MSKLNICFMGSDNFSLSILQYLIGDMGDVCNVVALYTQPPRPKGRKRQLSNSKIQDFANSLNINTFTPFKFDNENIAQFQQLAQNVDIHLNIVASYGLILPESILYHPKYNSINVHTSLLPKYRGAAPVERALEKGDTHTGVTLMLMNKGLDTGDIIAQSIVNITKDTRIDGLYDSLRNVACDLLKETLSNIDNITHEPQNSLLSTYAKPISNIEKEINWTLSAVNIFNKIRAFENRGGCYCYVGEERLKILQSSVISNEPHSYSPGYIVNLNPLSIATGQGILSLELIQRPGKRPLNSKEFCLGFSLKIGDNWCKGT